MFGKRIKLFKLLDFEVRIDLSWIIIALLIAWSLSTGLFPFYYMGLSAGMYWLMGAIGALGLFLSIIIHEFAHSLVARRQGMPMHGITLFIFGGVAQMGKEPPGPKEEFLMATVGPLSSFALSFFFYMISVLGPQTGWPLPVMGVVRYLASINMILAIFNLIPAFPLDGGRVLRSFLWRIKGNLMWATRVSSSIGVFFGFLLIGYGFLRMFDGFLIGGMWMILIGMFLQSAAKMSYQQLIIRQMLKGEPVRHFMQPDPVMVSPSVTIEQLVKDYIYRHHLKMVPVSDSGELKGCILAEDIRNVPREQWPKRTAGELAGPCRDGSTVDPHMNASELLSRMSRTGSTRFIVVEGDQVVGAVSMKDIMKSLSLRMEFEQ